MNQFTFNTELKLILSQIGQVERPDGLKCYVESKQGAFEKLKRLLVNAICSDHKLDKVKLILSEMTFTNGFTVFDLLWIDQKARTFVLLLEFITKLFESNLWEYFNLITKCHVEEHLINCLMMIKHKGYENVVDAVCLFLNRPETNVTLDNIAHIFTEAFKRLELESVPENRLIKLASRVFFARFNDVENENELIYTVEMNNQDHKLLEMISYLVKYGNYQFFFIVFERYIELYNRMYKPLEIKFIKKLCKSTKYAHIQSSLVDEKREMFLVTLFSHKVFGDGFPNRTYFLNSIAKVCSEWSMKLLMCVQDLFVPGLEIQMNSLRDYRVRLVYQREASINRLVDSFQKPFNQQPDKALFGEILDCIDALLKKNVSKDIIPLIMSFEFMVHFPSQKENVRNMSKFLVAERKAPASVVPVDIERFGI